ncbi:MAG: hypothetical protein JXA96_08345 [Sedimentisphaerales bacterium]|nr:hypothetical protein [Sedimentisphaerales bacterium]
MKRLISIVLVMLIALMFSGCVIVDAHYHNRHRRYNGVVVTNFPPPPPPKPVYVISSSPPRPPVVVVKPSHSRSKPLHKNYKTEPGGRRNLRR